MLLRILLGVGLLMPHGAYAQSLGAGLRAGAGWDRAGQRVYAGQLEIVEFGRWSSIEVGLGALEGGVTENYDRMLDLVAHA